MSEGLDIKLVNEADKPISYFDSMSPNKVNEIDSPIKQCFTICWDEELGYGFQLTPIRLSKSKSDN